MSHRSILPPHLADEESIHEEGLYIEKCGSKIGPQGPSKYGPGGRRLYKAKSRPNKK